MRSLINKKKSPFHVDTYHEQYLKYYKIKVPIVIAPDNK
jgi:hypothetical protein